MKRRPGVLLPIEISILRTGLEMRRAGGGEFHGYLLTEELRTRGETESLLSHGTIYRALDRLEAIGLVASRMEEPAISEHDRRPRRHLFRVTKQGEEALARVRANSAIHFAVPERGAGPA